MTDINKSLDKLNTCVNSIINYLANDASPIPDGSKWITLEDGHHVLIGKTGQVISGAGGALNGKYYSSHGTGPVKEESIRQKEDRENSEKWLSYVEHHANVGSLYNHGVTKLQKEFNISQFQELNDRLQTAIERAKRRTEQPQAEKVDRKPTMPTSGRITSDDPSIFGSELLGWEGEKWEKFHYSKRYYESMNKSLNSDKPKESVEKKPQVEAKKKMPTSGRVTQEDVLIWGQELQGWVGKRWQQYHSYS